MIIFERDKPRNIIIWSIVFLISSLIGGVVYLILRIIYYKKRNSLIKKQWEDGVYLGLSTKNILNKSIDTTDDFYTFNNLAFNSVLTKNNSYEIINSYSRFKEILLKDLSNAKKYIILELTKVNKVDFKQIADVLVKKASMGVAVKFIHDKHVSRKMLKQLKLAGVKAYNFSNYKSCGRIYANRRNLISVDGEIIFVGSLNVTKRQLSDKFEISDLFFKLKGDVVQEINIAMHQDAVFASGKYIELPKPVETGTNNNCKMQFISNQINNDIELLLIKAICMAKKSIQLQLDEFIPTESIMSLLKFAIHSNIDVRLMVPLKTTMHDKYFASRAYAKELALEGANVYLFDGFIRSNSIIIDNLYAICGSYCLNRDNVKTCLQNIIIIEDNKAIESFNKKFDKCVNNSYRISNAKYMLLREKFFKNFV